MHINLHLPVPSSSWFQCAQARASIDTFPFGECWARAKSAVPHQHSILHLRSHMERHSIEHLRSHTHGAPAHTLQLAACLLVEPTLTPVSPGALHFSTHHVPNVPLTKGEHTPQSLAGAPAHSRRASCGCSSVTLMASLAPTWSCTPRMMGAGMRRARKSIRPRAPPTHVMTPTHNPAMRACKRGGQQLIRDLLKRGTVGTEGLGAWLAVRRKSQARTPPKAGQRHAATFSSQAHRRLGNSKPLHSNTTTKGVKQPLASSKAVPHVHERDT